jgi:cation diffusion facilitator CzcD-associated flavoprotein CzcO
MATHNSTLDILVVGVGQAGLALGYHLKATPLRFQLVEGHPRIGDSWRQRYDSLVLFTPRAYSALPGLAVPGDLEGYPTRDEIADYLESYARHFALPVLVVGDGASGRQMARELAATHQVLLSTGRPRRVSPERILGKSVFWWMDKLGIARASRESAIGEYLMKADSFPGKALGLKRLERQGVTVVCSLLVVTIIHAWASFFSFVRSGSWALSCPIRPMFLIASS